MRAQAFLNRRFTVQFLVSALNYYTKLGAGLLKTLRGIVTSLLAWHRLVFRPDVE